MNPVEARLREREAFCNQREQHHHAETCDLAAQEIARLESVNAALLKAARGAMFEYQSYLTRGEGERAFIPSMERLREALVPFIDAIPATEWSTVDILASEG